MKIAQMIIAGSALASLPVFSAAAIGQSNAGLPAGRYEIKATQDGRSIDRHVVVKSKGSQQLAFVWKKEASAGQAAPRAAGGRAKFSRL